MKKVLQWSVVLFFIVGCNIRPPSNHPIVPTAAPSIPPRTLGRADNFPWQEKWRLTMRLDDSNAHSNLRNFIALKEGIIFSDNPTGAGWDSRLKFATASQGHVQWTVDLNGMVDNMVFDGELIYLVGFFNGPISLRAYQLQTGALAWQAKRGFPGHRGYDLWLEEQNLYVYSTIDSDPIYHFNAETGKLAERLKVPGIREDTFLLFQFDNQDLLQQANERLMLTRGNKVLWETHLGRLVRRFPEFYQDLLIVRFEDREQLFPGLAGIDVTTGEIRWQRPGQAFSNFVIADDLLYVITGTAVILVLDPQTGETVGWLELSPNQVDTTHPVSAIAVYGNMLYVYFRDSLELIAFEKIND